LIEAAEYGIAMIIESGSGHYDFFAVFVSNNNKKTLIFSQNLVGRGEMSMEQILYEFFRTH